MKISNIYIAGSFADPKDRLELEKLVHKVRLQLHENGGDYVNFYVPMEHKIEEDFQKPDGTWNLPNHVWAKKVFDMDMEHLYNADMVIAMYTGTNGTSWEIGFAYAKGIPVYIYVPEYAKSKDMSLMVLNGSNGYIEYHDEFLIDTNKEELLKKLNQK